MLKQISWMSYFEFIGLLLITYYLFAVFFYYHHRFKKRFATHNVTNELEQHKENDSEAKDNIKQNIKEHIKAAIADNLSKDDLLKSLAIYITANSDSQETLPKKEQVNYSFEVIEDICSIHLSEEDLRVLLE